MLKVFLGIVLGALLIAGGVYFYFFSGYAPVATSAPPMPFERKLTRLGLHSYLEKLPHPVPQVPADEASLIAGAKVYKDHCALCHGFPGKPKSVLAQGMYPAPPQLFQGVGVTDDEPWESYWKVENGIRLSGMPAFKGRLTETEIWQVSVLLKNADKITPPVKAALASASLSPQAPAKKK